MLAAIVKEQVIVFVGPACNLEIPRLGPIISSQSDESKGHTRSSS